MEPGTLDESLTTPDDSRAADAAARRWLQAMRRIDSITIRVRAGRTTATLRGIGHRLPVSCTISLVAAAGLARRGVPITIDDRG